MLGVRSECGWASGPCCGRIPVQANSRDHNDIYSPQRPMDKHTKPCPECGTAMKPGRTTLHFERDGFYADVENVTAMLCGRCGARSIPGPIALKISDAVERLFKAGKGLDSTGISFHKIAS